MLVNKLANILTAHSEVINSWYKEKLKTTKKILYHSVDIRYNGEKIVPVDINLFPAGFNNLDHGGFVSASRLLKDYIQENFIKINKILLLTESHDRNLFYQQNVLKLLDIINSSGYECQNSSLNPKDLSQFKIQNNLLKLSNGFTPDLVILNNDLIEGMPEVLKDIIQPIIPSANLGWFRRRKSNHFAIYQELITELAHLLPLPWFNLVPLTQQATLIDFHDKSDLLKLAEEVTKFIDKIKISYQEHQLLANPYVVIKANYGTYGMGVIAVKSGEDVINLNKKNRQKMYTTKSAIKIDDIIMQEGIRTIDTYQDFAAEPMIYQVNHHTVNYFYRYNSRKTDTGILNSSGMDIVVRNDLASDFYLCYDFISKIAALAASLEEQQK